jgi:C4-dicarboxylate-specific signal transduction histidine kinase
VKEALSKLESWRFEHRPRQQDVRGGLFEELDIAPIKATFQKRHPEDKEFVKYLDERARKVKKSVKEVQNVLVRYRRLATLGQLIDVVLHEGRTPITALSNECDLGLRALKKAKSLDGLQEDVARRYEVIKNQSTQLFSLFRRIAPFGGRKRGRPIRKTVEEMIRESFAVFTSHIDELEVDVSLPTGETSVKVDPPEFQQIIINLLDNALYWIAKVPAGKRKIEVKCQRVDDGVEVLFCDSGPGVPEDVQDKIFDPYFSTKPDGVGLGLSIVGETAAEYDGTLELVSPGLLSGANFRVLLRRRVGDDD